MLYLFLHVITHSSFFTLSLIVNPAAKYSLATTEDALEAASLLDDDIWNHVDIISIFARMSPQGKARVIRAMQDRKGHQRLVLQFI